MNREEVFKAAHEEHEAFLRSLGNLTLAWADLELVLYKLLKRYAGVSDGVGRAVFSGSRAGAMISFVRAIAENTNMDAGRRDDLEEMFEQISAINSMRDFVVHHVSGSEQEFEPENPRERVLTDSRRVSRIKNAKRVYIGSETLVAMHDDIVECCWRMHAHTDMANEPFSPGPGTGGVRTPWKYKPPHPTKRKGTGTR